jgi:hypothetical protein
LPFESLHGVAGKAAFDPCIVKVTITVEPTETVDVAVMASEVPVVVEDAVPI